MTRSQKGKGEEVKTGGGDASKQFVSNRIIVKDYELKILTSEIY